MSAVGKSLTLKYSIDSDKPEITHNPEFLEVKRSITLSEFLLITDPIKRICYYLEAHISNDLSNSAMLEYVNNSSGRDLMLKCGLINSSPGDIGFRGRKLCDHITETAYKSMCVGMLETIQSQLPTFSELICNLVYETIERRNMHIVCSNPDHLTIDEDSFFRFLWLIGIVTSVSTYRSKSDETRLRGITSLGKEVLLTLKTKLASISATDSSTASIISHTTVNDSSVHVNMGDGGQAVIDSDKAKISR